MILSVHMFDMQAAFLHEVTNEVKVDLYVLHAGMVYRIEAEVCGAKVVAEELRGSWSRNAEFLE